MIASASRIYFTMWNSSDSAFSFLFCIGSVALSVMIVILCCIQIYVAFLLALPCPSGLCPNTLHRLVFFIFMTSVDINETHSLLSQCML